MFKPFQVRLLSYWGLKILLDNLILLVALILEDGKEIIAILLNAMYFPFLQDTDTIIQFLTPSAQDQCLDNNSS